MSRELATKIEALELAKHAHVDYDVPVGAALGTGWMTVSPDTSFEGKIIYWMTYGDNTTRIWRLKAMHRGYSLGTKILGEDEVNHGIACWVYVTAQEPLLFSAENTSAATATLHTTLWYLNVTTLKQMDRIRVVIWEYMCPGLLSVALRNGWIQGVTALPDSELEECLRVSRNRIKV